MSKRRVSHFTKEQEEEIKREDEGRCVICGRDERYGLKMDVDLMLPLSLGGKVTLANGMTLCEEHIADEEGYDYLEGTRQMFMGLREAGLKVGDKLADYCEDILDIYEKRGIDSHIKRDEPKPSCPEGSEQGE